jgi:hypothetical protein
VLGQRDRRPVVDLVVLVTVGEQHRADEFYVVTASELYDFAEGRHDARRAMKPDSLSGERTLVQLQYRDLDVKAFLDRHRDKWELVEEPAVRGKPQLSDTP